MGSVREGGQVAVTDFTVLEELPYALHMEARPRTGRKHQIRVHLAEAGLPILGDPLYDVRAVPDVSPRAAPHVAPHARATPARASIPSRLMLHARQLSLPHPLTGAVLSIDSSLPPDFCRFLESLRAGAPAGPRRRRH